MNTREEATCLRWSALNSEELLSNQTGRGEARQKPAIGCSLMDGGGVIE